MPEVQRPPAADIRRDFKIHSATLKAIKKEIDGKTAMYLEGTASSTVRDRHGDTITEGGQNMMLEKARGLTMWLNHSYDVPEDILGTCQESELVGAKDDDGNDILDLIIRCKVDSENPRAVKAWRHVEGGTQLAFSIGGAITEAEVDEENDDGSSWCPPLIINGIDLYEISLVGIPANPRAYTRDFVQEMSRGFMRNASRNPEVQKQLRKALPALRVKDAIVIYTALKSDGTWEGDVVAKSADPKKPYGDVEYADPGYQSDGVHRYPLDTVQHIRSAASYFGRQSNRDEYTVSQQKEIDQRIAAAEKRHGIGAAAHAHKMIDKSAGGPIMRDPEVEPTEPGHLENVVAAMKCLAESAAHGLCIEGVESVRKAHAHLMQAIPEGYELPGEALLPDGSEPMEAAAHIQVEKLAPKAGDVVIMKTTGPTSDAAYAHLDELRTSFEGVQFIAIHRDDSVETLLDSVRSEIELAIDEQNEVRQQLDDAKIEFEELSSAKEQRTVEVAEAQARIDALKASETALQTKIAELKSEQTEIESKIAELKATPTGRQTAKPGGSSSGAYQPRSQTIAEARRRLGAKMQGVALTDDPALRPA